jgi:hypothetical protein
MSEGILLAVKQLDLQQSRFIRSLDIALRSVRALLTKTIQREKHVFRSIGCRGGTKLSAEECKELENSRSTNEPFSQGSKTRHAERYNESM